MFASNSLAEMWAFRGRPSCCDAGHHPPASFRSIVVAITSTTPASGPVGPVSEPSPNAYGNPSPNVANIQPGSLQQPALIAAAPQEVIVDFRSTPTGADIRVDGSMVGSTPSSISLSLGEHIITISKQDFRTYERTMTVKAGHPVVAAYLQQVKTTIQFDHPQ